jgi:predicted RNA binding protein YcfA (HicA-like mRNA interferase family)
LSKYGYTISRQTGSHVRSITIPAHTPIKVGTLNNILKDIAAYLKMTKEELVEFLFYKK